MAKSLFARLQMLRTQIEVSAPAPAIILLTSATPDDGATVSAISLADCLASAGHRVAFLGSSFENVARRGEQPPISILLISNELAAGTRASGAVAELADKMRREYDYTIIDAPPLTESSVSILLASTADLVLLTIRIGRSACAEDESMMEALQLAEARVLGVIGVSDANIRERGRTARLEAAPNEPVPWTQQPGRRTTPITTIP